MLFNLRLSIDDTTLLLIDKLRDQLPREVFLRRAVELGLCQLVADAANVSSDKIMHLMRGSTVDWRQAKTLVFTVDADPQQPPETPR